MVNLLPFQLHILIEVLQSEELKHRQLLLLLWTKWCRIGWERCYYLHRAVVSKALRLKRVLCSHHEFKVKRLSYKRRVGRCELDSVLGVELNEERAWKEIFVTFKWLERYVWLLLATCKTGFGKDVVKYFAEFRNENCLKGLLEHVHKRVGDVHQEVDFI
jgi:hypothetical protein